MKKYILALSMVLVSNSFASEGPRLIKCSAAPYGGDIANAIDFPFDGKVKTIEVEPDGDSVAVRINGQSVNFRMCLNQGESQVTCALLTSIEGKNLREFNSREMRYQVAQIKILSTKNSKSFSDGYISGSPHSIAAEPFSLTPMGLKCTSEN
ncbi:MAG: hypothetical protein ACXVLQ_13375 [Bacteriovorax sp.]